jgi:hypothetical protein
MATITARNPLREGVASLSTGNQNPDFQGGRAPYYSTPQDWWVYLATVCRNEGSLYPPNEWATGPWVRPEAMPDIHCQDGYSTIPLWKGVFDADGHAVDPPEQVGQVWFSWHRMQSGNWEIICYIA